MSRAPFVAFVLATSCVASPPSPAPRASTTSAPPAASASSPPDLSPAPAGPASSRVSDAPIEEMPVDAILEAATISGFLGGGFGTSDTGLVVHGAWLENTNPRRRHASIVVVDFSETQRHASDVGSDRALFLDVFRAKVLGAPASSPHEVLETLVRSLPRGTWDVSAMQRATTSEGFEGITARSDPPRRTSGVTRITGAYRRENTAVELTFYDYREARAEGRVLVDGHRIAFVTVCSACPDSYPWPEVQDPPFVTAEDIDEARTLVTTIAQRARARAATLGTPSPRTGAE